MQSRNWYQRSAILIAAAALGLSAQAQDGSFDPAFGSSGRTWIDVSPSTADAGKKMIRLPSGNLFIGGACNFVACATWLTPSGAFATGFGTSGTGTALFSVFSGWPNDEDGITDAAAFSDGRVAVTLSRSGGGYVAVLKADGSGLDPAVGNGAGYVSTSFSTLLVRVTPQQQVIVAGTDQAAHKSTAFARYDSTLHVDGTFGTAGSTAIGYDGLDAIPSSMALQRDGKIVAIEVVRVEPATYLAIFRLTSGGSPDPDFGSGSDGRFASLFGNTYGVVGSDIAVDEKGRLVIVGLGYTDGNIVGKWFIDRLLGNAGVDMAFNGGQPFQFNIGMSQQQPPAACCVAIQGDGRIVMAGSALRADNVNRYFAVARFKDDGSGDASFGGGSALAGGEMSSAANVVTDSPQTMLIVPGGILVGGSTTVSGGESRFSAAKMRIDLLFAASFD